MTVIYDNDMMKQIHEIAEIVEREGVVNFMCSETVHHNTGHFCGLDVMLVNGQVHGLKACDLEIVIKAVPLANDNSVRTSQTMALHFEHGSPAILAQWHQTVTSFMLSAHM